MAFADRKWRWCLVVSLALLSGWPSLTAQRARRSRAIRVVIDVDYAPYSFQSSEGKLQGIVIDQWILWEKKTGIRAEVHALQWAEALDDMRAGEFDVIENIFETPERRKYLDFTAPYTTVKASIFFRNEISGITGIASLKGFPVGAKAGDQHIQRLKEAGVTTIIVFESYDDIVEAAKQRKINVFVADEPAALYRLNKAHIASEFRRSAPIFHDQLRRAVRKGDVETMAVLTSGFLAIDRNELTKIDEKWFGTSINDYSRYLVWAGYVAVAALLLIAVLAAWNRTLRRRILQRTAALRESEERFRQIAENIREVFWLTSFDSARTLYVSPAYEELYGQSPESLYWDPRSFFEALHPEDRIRVAEAMHKNGELGFEVEYRVVRSDGSVRWIRDRGFPIRDEAERVYRYAGIAEDITEWKRAADALKEAEDRVRLIIDTIPAMVWSLRPDGVLDFVNQRWLDYVGVSFEEALQGPMRALHTDDVSRTLCRWRDDNASGQPSQDEVRLRRADGEYRWFLIRTVPLTDEDGKIVKWYGTSTDIEDRKRAEEKLARSEHQLVEAQSTAHVGSWEWDVRANVGTWSEEYCRLFGLRPSDTFPDEALSLIHPDDRDRVLKTADRAMNRREPYEIDYRIVRKDGSERVVHSIANVSRDETGAPIRFFGATQDVTDLKRAEADLNITTEQMRALSVRLRSTREEEGIRIAREIHDEVGATLTSLRWEVEGIKKKLSEPGKVLPAADVNEKVATTLDLIDTLISEIRRIASDLRPVVLDVLGVKEAIEWQAQEFQARTGISVHCDSIGTGPADLNPEHATAVFRIFQEALTNTLRHAQATRVDVTMEEEAGAYVLKIRDNGRGITEQEKARPSSLGLLGMRERAGLIGGEVDVAGVSLQGTTVTVRLPIAAACSEKDRDSTRRAHV